MLLKGYNIYIYIALKGMRLISKLRLLKSFVKAPVYSAMRFGTLGMLEISYKKSALIVFHVLYAYCIFSILGVLSFKLNQVKLLLSFIGFNFSS